MKGEACVIGRSHFLELLLLRLASARFAFISAHLNKKNRTICGSAGKSLFRCTSFSIVEVVLKGNISPLLAQCVSETATDGQIHKKNRYSLREGSFTISTIL